MKLPAVLVAALITLAPAVALAGHGLGHGKIVREQRKQRMIERFDTDGDGELSRAEKKRAKKAIKAERKQLRRAGRLAKVARREARFDRIIDRLDVNGDGVVGPEEAGDRFEHLRRFDLDGDGWVTREELRAGRKQQRRARRAGD